MEAMHRQFHLDEIGIARLSNEQTRSLEQALASPHMRLNALGPAVLDADEASVEMARQLFLRQRHAWRQTLQTVASVHDLRGSSTNPLNLCGTPSKENERFLRSLPGRVTRAQMLAALLLNGFVAQQVLGPDVVSMFLKHSVVRPSDGRRWAPGST
jgi:hypothetical protein